MKAKELTKQLETGYDESKSLQYKVNSVSDLIQRAKADQQSKSEQIEMLNNQQLQRAEQLAKIIKESSQLSMQQDSLKNDSTKLDANYKANLEAV